MNTPLLKHDQDEQSKLLNLLDIMSRLRDPQNGCPWDVEQTFQSLTKYTIEEAYEVADAAHRNHMDDLVEELGDLLLQVVFYAQIGKESGLFTFDDIAERVSQKLVSRHPHVFGDKDASSAADVMVIWEAQKDKEKAKRDSVLDDVPPTLPPLQRAEKLMKRAGKIGFKFDNPAQAREKFYEELHEFESALNSLPRAGGDPWTPEQAGGVISRDEVLDEYGDVLFSFIAWARMACAAEEISSDEALDHANRKFEERFRAVEILAKKAPPQDLDAWKNLWAQAKENLVYS